MNWLKVPDKPGYWWVASLVTSREGEKVYQPAGVVEIEDHYEGEGLEVIFDYPISVTEYCQQYPDFRWQYIPEPEMPEGER